MIKDTLNKNITIEFANQPPTVDDIPEYKLKLFARCLVQAYNRYKKKEEETNTEVKL